MAGESSTRRPLFGGAISTTFPVWFQVRLSHPPGRIASSSSSCPAVPHLLELTPFWFGLVLDVSNIREVPDHQEVLVDPARDESLIFELLDLKGEVEDGGSALWFLRDVANEQDAGDNLVMEHSGTVELPGLRLGEAPALAGTAIARMAVSKGRQGREAQNIVRLYLANIRLKNAATDVVITAYEPLLINPLSESAQAVAAGPAVPAEQAGCLPMSEVFRLAVMNFDVHDWNLFNGSS